MIHSSVKTGLVSIKTGGVLLRGDLSVPSKAIGVVLFAHGSGSSRFSPRNRHVAQALEEAGLATLLMDLLTSEEEIIDQSNAQFRFNIRLLADRVHGCAEWLKASVSTKELPVGYFGASTGAAAALVAAAEYPQGIFAVVSRGGRPDLAEEFLPRVEAPTLLIVGGLDPEVLTLNREAARRMRSVCSIKVVPGASHLFEEQGALEKVSKLAADWFIGHLIISQTRG